MLLQKAKLALAPNPELQRRHHKRPTLSKSSLVKVLFGILTHLLQRLPGKPNSLVDRELSLPNLLVLLIVRQVAKSLPRKTTARKTILLVNLRRERKGGKMLEPPRRVPNLLRQPSLRAARSIFQVALCKN